MNFNWEDKIQDSIASAMGIVKYISIMKEYRTNGISDKFKKLFKSFYVVRFNEEWQNSFFDYFKNVQKKDIEYKKVIEDLSEKTSRVEASFASKLITTIDPNMPIYDSQIIAFMKEQNMDIKSYSTNKEKQKENAIHNYEEIQKWFNTFKDSKEGRLYIKRFNEILPKYADKLSDIKKIDFLIWADRTKDEQ